MALSQLIYISRSLLERQVERGLTAIQVASARNNADFSVSGLLLYSGGHFLQILEGREAVIERLFHKISGDPRHTDVTRLICQRIEDRLFENWQMGLLNLDRESAIDRQRFEDLATACRRSPRSQQIANLYREFRDQLQSKAELACA
jgi:hypothetical protein